MTTVWKEPGDVLVDEGYALSDIQVVASRSYAKNRTSGYKVEAGIYSEGRFDVLGSVDTAETALSDGVPLTIITKAARDKKLYKGHQLMVKVTKAGSPANIQGTAVLFKLKRGGVDGGRPLIAGQPEDQTAQEVNRRLGIQYARINLSEPVSDVSTEDVQYGSDSDTGTTSYSSATYASFSPVQSVTVTPPDKEGTYIVSLWARFTLVGTAGATLGDARIRNTTDSTDIDEMTQIAAASPTLDQCFVLMGQEEITEEKTYELQFNKDAGAATNMVAGQPKIMFILTRKEAVTG